MLNIEKYKEELENIGVINSNGLAVIDGKPCMCQEAECNMCEFRSEESCCFYKTDNWLFSEYKEPEIDWSKVKVDTPILVKDILKSDQNGLKGILLNMKMEGCMFGKREKHLGVL